MDVNPISFAFRLVSKDLVPFKIVIVNHSFTNGSKTLVAFPTCYCSRNMVFLIFLLSRGLRFIYVDLRVYLQDRYLIALKLKRVCSHSFCCCYLLVWHSTMIEKLLIVHGGLNLELLWNAVWSSETLCCFLSFFAPDW